MATCSSCSAPLLKVICEYCGTRNDVDLTHISNFSDTKPNENRYCPNCEIPLVTTNLSIDSKMYVERCGGCYGLFFDKGELQALIELSVEHKSHEIDYKRLSEIIEHPYHRDSVEYRRCPVCKDFMQRKNYLKRSGVIVDRCVNHGIWLDSGELKQIMEFIRLGGESLSQEDERTSKKFKERVSKKESKESREFINEGNMSVSDAIFQTFGDIARLFD